MSFSEQIKEEILNNFNGQDSKYLKLEKFGECLSAVNTKNQLKEDFSDFFDIAMLDEKGIKSLLKGVFLSSGCIVNPKNDYHLEINFKSKACADYIYHVLSLIELTPKIIKRKNANRYVIYIKESDQIAIFLSILEANKAVLEFEQIRVEKQVKNNINRNINCETANLAKTIKSGLRQLDSIKKLKKTGKFNNLDDKLKYAASLREKYPDKSLSYIINMINSENKLSKSGLKHRLDKLVQIADEL